MTILTYSLFITVRPQLNYNNYDHNCVRHLGRLDEYGLTDFHGFLGFLFLLSLSVLSDVFGAVDKTSSSFSAHGKIGNFFIIIIIHVWAELPSSYGD